MWFLAAKTARFYQLLRTFLDQPDQWSISDISSIMENDVLVVGNISRKIFMISKNLLKILETGWIIATADLSVSRLKIKHCTTYDLLARLLEAIHWKMENGVEVTQKPTNMADSEPIVNTVAPTETAIATATTKRVTTETAVIATQPPATAVVAATTKRATTTTTTTRTTRTTIATKRVSKKCNNCEFDELTQPAALKINGNFSLYF